MDGKYIDRAALFNSLANAKTLAEAFSAIQAAPAADVQEVMTEDDVKEWCIKRNYALVAREDFPGIMEVRHGRWIPVTERLPKEHEEVLTYNPVFGITFDSMHNGKWRKHPVAWMPLPEPYKEKEDE